MVPLQKTREFQEISALRSTAETSGPGLALRVSSRRPWTSRGLRLVCTLLCKLALLVSMVNVSAESFADEEEVKRVSEEVLFVETLRATGLRHSAHERRLSSHVIRHLPAVAAQRLVATDTSLGHVLHNGLRAPLRC